MDNLNYIINLSLKDNKISVAIKDLKAGFASLDNSVNKVNQAFTQVTADITENLTEVNSSVQNVGTAVSQTAGTITNKLGNINMSAMIDMVKNAADAFKNLLGSELGTTFEQSMADLSSITGIVGKDLKDLADTARRTGKESGLGAAGAADAFALLASQIQVDTIGMEGLKVLQKETITLAQAAGMGMADAATAMAATINQFGLEAGEANRVINVLAAGSKYGAAEITDLAQSFKVTGATASAAGLSVEQTAGAIEVLSKMNMKGAEAGTALRNILLKMQTTLGIDLGETGLSTALEALKPKLNDVTYLAKLFGAENISAAQFLITNASAVDEMTRAVTGTGVAQEQAAIRTNTTAEQMKRMQAAIDDVRIGFFNLTGGLSAYISTVGDGAVMVAQMIPLFSAAKNGVLALANMNLSAKAAVIGRMVAEKASIAVTAAVTAAQAALNAVMSANPVAMVVLAIGALVAGLIAAYNRCEGFRKVVDAAWTGIKRFASAVWDNLCKAFAFLSDLIGKVWGKLKQLFGIETETAEATGEVAVATQELAAAQQSAIPSLDLFSGSLTNQNKQLRLNLATLGGVAQKIQDLKKAQQAAGSEQAIALEKEIRLWQKKQDEMRNAITIGAAERPEMKPVEAPKAEGTLAVTPVVDLEGLNGSLKAFKEKINKALPAKEMFSPLTEGLTAIGNLMGNLSGVVGESAGAWLQWGASLMQTVAQAIPQIVALGNAQITAANAQVVANTAVAATGAAASVSSIPIVGWIMAGAAVASILAMLASIPKPKAFAAGGIVSGPTYALVGEYSGAQNNPEVIAPLNKLKSMIEPAGFNPGKLYLETKVRGKDLYVALRSVEHEKQRTR